MIDIPILGSIEPMELIWPIVGIFFAYKMFSTMFGGAVSYAFGGLQAKRDEIKIDEDEKLNFTEMSKQIYQAKKDECKRLGPGHMKYLYANKTHHYSKCLGKIIGFVEDQYMSIFLVSKNGFKTLYLTNRTIGNHSRNVVVQDTTPYTISHRKIMGLVRYGHEMEDYKNYVEYVYMIAYQLILVGQVNGMHTNILQSMYSQYDKQEIAQHKVHEQLERRAQRRVRDYDEDQP